MAVIGGLPQPPRCSSAGSRSNPGALLLPPSTRAAMLHTSPAAAALLMLTARLGMALHHLCPCSCKCGASDVPEPASASMLAPLPACSAQRRSAPQLQALGTHSRCSLLLLLPPGPAMPCCQRGDEGMQRRQGQLACPPLQRWETSRHTHTALCRGPYLQNLAHSIMPGHRVGRDHGQQLGMPEGSSFGRAVNNKSFVCIQEQARSRPGAGQTGRCRLARRLPASTAVFASPLPF